MWRCGEGVAVPPTNSVCQLDYTQVSVYILLNDGRINLISRIRPQVLGAILILGTIAILGIFKGMTEISGVASAGIIALAKDVITTDV